MELHELAGEHIFSGYERGVSNTYRGYWFDDYMNYIQFTLDNITYRIHENPEDGYRSCCENLEIVDANCNIVIPDTEVICKYVDISEKYANYSMYCDILEIIDKETNKIIVRVGTDNTDDYYPFIVNEWYPENLACNA